MSKDIEQRLADIIKDISYKNPLTEAYRLSDLITKAIRADGWVHASELDNFYHDICHQINLQTKNVLQDDLIEDAAIGVTEAIKQKVGQA